MIKVIAVDPGVTTGFAYANVYPEHTDSPPVEFFPFQLPDDVDDFWARLERFKPDYIVMEDFKYRNNRYQTGINLFPVQLIGIARLYEIKRGGGCKLFLQSPAQGKSYFTDAVLKNMNCYRRALDHGRDATRHLLQWLMFGYGNQFIGKQNSFALMLDDWGKL